MSEISLDSGLTMDELETLDYMQKCTKLDPADVAPVSTCSDDGWNVNYVKSDVKSGDSDGNSE